MVMKKIRKSIHITNPVDLPTDDKSVLTKPVEEEEEFPSDGYEDANKLTSRSDWFTNMVHSLTTRYMRSGTARLVVIFAAVLSCITYVLDTYSITDVYAYRVFSNMVDIAAFVIFLADYVFNILFADSKPGYIFSFQGLVDFASLFSILNVFVSEDLSFLALFRLMRVLKVMRVFRLTSVMLSIDEHALPSASEAIYFDILSLGMGILLAWFLFSSLLFTMIQQDENAFIYSLDPTVDLQQELRFFDCMYIMMVITSTLGFGDYAPYDTWGRLFVIVVLLSALTIVPMQVGRLIETVGKNPRYIVNVYNPVKGNRQHIVLAANLNSRDFQNLINLILSEGSNDPEIMDHSAPIAIMSSVYPSAQLELLLNHPINTRKVQFFIGNVKNQSDLRRVKADTAKAMLIFIDDVDREAVETVDSVIQDDYSLKLKIVSVMNYFDQEAKRKLVVPPISASAAFKLPILICQTVSHEVCFSLLNKGVDRIISNNNIKYSMMAYGAMFPGKNMCMYCVLCIVYFFVVSVCYWLWIK
jgi:voltage-gated potassium channel